MEAHTFQEQAAAIAQYITARTYRIGLSTNAKRGLRRAAEKFYVEDDKLFYRGLKGDKTLEVISDEAEQKRKLQAAHMLVSKGNKQGHCGRDKMIRQLCTKFYWPGICRDISHYVRKCSQCNRSVLKIQHFSKPCRPKSIPKPNSTTNSISSTNASEKKEKTRTLPDRFTFSQMTVAITKYLSGGGYVRGMSTNGKRALRRTVSNYIIDNDKLFYRGSKGDKLLEVISNLTEQHQLLDTAHGSLGKHSGRDKMIRRLCANYYWPGICQDIIQFVKRCDQCQQSPKHVKHLRQVTSAPQPVSSTQIWEKVVLNVIGPLTETQRGSKYIVTLMDDYSKWSEAQAVAHRDASSVALFLCGVMTRMGVPHKIISELEEEFNNNLIDELFALTLAKHNITSSCGSEANGVMQKNHETVVNVLEGVVNDDETDWDLHIDGVLFDYRTTPQGASNISPFELMFNRKPLLFKDLRERELSDNSHEDSSNVEPMDSCENLDNNEEHITIVLPTDMDLTIQESQEIQDDSQNVEQVFNVGDIVLKKNNVRNARGKLELMYSGPFSVTECIDGGKYQLTNVRSGKSLIKGVNARHLELYDDQSDDCEVEESPDKAIVDMPTAKSVEGPSTAAPDQEVSSTAASAVVTSEEVGQLLGDITAIADEDTCPTPEDGK